MSSVDVVLGEALAPGHIAKGSEGLSYIPRWLRLAAAYPEVTVLFTPARKGKASAINRGVALWGNLVVSVTSHDGRVIATDKETGKIVWDRNLRDQPDMTLNAAPLALADKIIIGASGGALRNAYMPPSATGSAPSSRPGAT